MAKVATTIKSLVGKDGNSYTITGENKVRKVNSLQDLKKLEVNLSEDYDKLNLKLYRYFKDQDADTTWRKSFVLYRMYKISYGANGLRIIDGKNYGRTIEHKLDAFPAPLEVYLFLSKLGVNKSILKEDKMKKLNETPVNELLQKVKFALSQDEVSARYTTKLFNQLLDDKTLEMGNRDKLRTKLVVRFPYLAKINRVEVKVEEPIVEEVDNKELINAARKKLITKLTKCTVGDTAVEIINANPIPHRGFKVLINKVVRAYTSNSISVKKFRANVFELLNDEANFAPRLKAAPKFIERPPYLFDELISIIDNKVTYVRNKSMLTTTPIEIYASELCSADPKVNVGIAKLIKGDITPEQFIKQPYMVDKTISLDYTDLKKVPADRVAEVTEALEDVMMQWEMPNPLHFVYKNQVKYEMRTKLKVYLRDTFSYAIGIIEKYDGGYRVRYENGEWEFLLKHQEVKILN